MKVETKSEFRFSSWLFNSLIAYPVYVGDFFFNGDLIVQKCERKNINAKIL